MLTPAKIEHWICPNCLVDEANEIIKQNERIHPPHREFINYEVAECVHTVRPEFINGFGGTITPTKTFGKASGLGGGLENQESSRGLTLPSDIDHFGDQVFMPDNLRQLTVRSEKKTLNPPPLIENRAVPPPLTPTMAMAMPATNADAVNVLNHLPPRTSITTHPPCADETNSTCRSPSATMLNYRLNKINPQYLDNEAQAGRIRTRSRNVGSPRIHTPPFTLPVDVYPPGYFDRPKTGAGVGDLEGNTG